MSNEEQELQNKIFARNLNHYIAESGKTQKEIAKDLGFHPSTFNTWCVGKISPSSGKIQRIADYFGIGKSDLTDPPHMRQVDMVQGEELDIILAYRAASQERKESVKLLLGLIEMG